MRIALFSSLAPLMLKCSHSIELPTLSAHSFFAWIARARTRPRSELGRFSMKTEVFREMKCRFLQSELGDPTFYSIYVKKIRICVIYPKLKNFSLFNFQIFRLIVKLNETYLSWSLIEILRSHWSGAKESGALPSGLPTLLIYNSPDHSPLKCDRSGFARISHLTP